MRKSLILSILCVVSVVVVSFAHYYGGSAMGFRGMGWIRLLLIAPIVYAGINYRRSGAISIALLICVSQGPLIIIKYSRYENFSIDHILSVITIAVLSVMFAHILRKEKDNSGSLEYIHDLIRSTRGSIDQDSLLSLLENSFAERSQSSEVSIFLFDSDGALTQWNNGSSPSLPEDHLFYTVAANSHFMVSANPEQDSRLTWYGPEAGLAGFNHLAVFPIEYGDRVRGCISIANSAGEHFGTETVSSLTAIKNTVENTLELGEKLRGRIQHELQRKKIRDVFSSYLSRTVAEEILNHPDDMDPGGDVRDVTIMFTEVANFSRLMKTVEPEELLSRLNEFFSLAIDTVFEFDGTLDKFIGNNVMAFWGAPLETQDSETKALCCAIKLQERLAELNRRREKEGVVPFDVSIGINSGPAVAGNIGSIRRMEYTIIGDSVNVAARIKSLGAQNGVRILIGENTFEKVKGKFEFDEQFQASVKGKSDSINIYRLKLKNGARH